jgi:tetratricopeptide (TPR) repeat protein
MRCDKRPSPGWYSMARKRAKQGLLRATFALLFVAVVSGCTTLLQPAVVPARTTAVAKGAADGDVGVNPAVRSAYDKTLRALKAGHTENAERGLRALTRSNPELAGPHGNLGIIYRHAGKLAESAAELEKAVSLNPRQPALFNQLGITYRQQGQFKKARDAYKEAISLDPTYAAAHLNLGILYDIYLWDNARALEHYRQYLSMSPGGDDKVNKWVADLNNRNQKRTEIDRPEDEG